MPSEARFLILRTMAVQSELTSAVPNITAGLRPVLGGADSGAAPVATRWTASDYSLEESKLVGAAVRVARNLAADLMGTGISFVLAGADGRELGRFAESAQELDTLDAAVLSDAGHWAGPTADAWDGRQRDGVLPPPGRVHDRRRVYAAAPIRREAEGPAAGLVVLVWTRDEPNPLMQPLARLVARDVELALADDATRRAELLTQTFSSRRRSPRPLLVVGPDTIWANAAATQSLGPVDAAALWDLAQALVHGRRREATVSGPGGQFRVTAEAIRDRDDLVGAVLSLATRHPASRPALGWKGLTATERAVSELVALGHTNREAGRELLMSPHTVGAHLRHIFQKLDVNSRVDLARLVGETHVARPRDDKR
jgi:DNA-binding CsgD family transcriptional regulator